VNCNRQLLYLARIASKIEYAQLLSFLLNDYRIMQEPLKDAFS